MAWLYLHLGEADRAHELVCNGLDHDSSNIYCLNLADRLRIWFGEDPEQKTSPSPPEGSGEEAITSAAYTAPGIHKSTFDSLRACS